MAKTILQIYSGTLYELDRYSAPVFHPSHFNYFYPDSVLDWLNDQCKLLELGQQNDDNLNIFTKIITLLPTGGVLTLPLDYFRLKNCIVTFKYTKDVGCNKKDSLFKKEAKRFPADLESASLENAYTRPSIRSVYRKIVGNTVQVLFGDSTDFAVVNIKVEYVASLILPPLNNDFTNVDNTVLLPFTDAVNAQHIDYTVKKFLENTGNQRLSSFLPTNQPVV